jgi:Cysteine-rich secretory protein family
VPTIPLTPRPAPTKPPTPRAAVVMPSIDTQWLNGHNARRANFYAQYGKSPMNLKWSPALKTSARNYARKLLQIGGTAACSIEHGYLGDSYGGENLAAVWGSGPFSNPLTPDNVLTAWYDEEIGLPYGQKGHATQVVFRSTRYVGCAGASKTLDSGGSCYIQVCRYISPGNCNMDSGNWLQRTLEDTSLCDPECPPDGCL